MDNNNENTNFLKKYKKVKKDKKPIYYEIIRGNFIIYFD